MEQKLTRFMGEEKTEPEDWTFASADTQYMSHGLHPYPARMIPQVARRLIQRFAKSQSDVVLDPFMGSGGVLVEAMLNGNPSIGVDLNPLAVLIAKVKTTPIDPNTIVKWADRLLHRLPTAVREDGLEVPGIRNVRFWFKPKAVRELATIGDLITGLGAPNEVIDFFKVCFSLTVRKASNIKNGEYKLYRRQGDELTKFKPDAIGVFREILKANIVRMHAFWEALKKLERVPKAYPLKGDTKDLLSVEPQLLGEETVSLVVTSPPYGDAHTTVAYGQFSRYSALWLGFAESEVFEIDQRGLGGTVLNEEVELASDTLKRILKYVGERDAFRAREVYAFFHDADTSLEQIARSLRKGKSRCCFVTGNRTVKRIEIPTDQILVELASKYGFQHIETKYRDIPTKTIPWINAPENIPGMTVRTISRESIIIWKY